MYDIIIQGGQSNAEGHGIGAVKEEYLPQDNICYFLDDRPIESTDQGLIVGLARRPFAVEVAKEREINGTIHGDFSLTFAQEYIKKGLLKNGRKLLIVRAAIGGTGFKKSHWGRYDYLYLRLLEMTNYALQLNPDNKVVGFLWHQGECDAFEGNPAEDYYKALLNMIVDVRSRYGNMPFIAGDFVNEWKSANMEICTPIVQAIRQVVKDCGNAAFVETADLLSNNQKVQNGDPIHFCKDSLHILGRRYFSAFSKLSN